MNSYGANKFILGVSAMIYSTPFSIDAHLESFLDLIPREINPLDRSKAGDFSRECPLTFPRVITLTLALTANSNAGGVDIQTGQFFSRARHSGLWSDIHAVSRGAVTKARQKVPAKVFQDILPEAVALAYDIWPRDPERYSWHGMSVFALDGSKFDLPATPEIRKHFDPASGLDHEGKGHYPQCLVSTVYDVLRRLPIARTVADAKGSERDELQNLLPCVPLGGVWMFDRGYPSYEVLQLLNQDYRGYYLFRCPAKGTFPAVERFVASGQAEAEIWLTPSNNYKRRVAIEDRKRLKALKVRIMRLESPDGTLSVLLTNLFKRKGFGVEEITALYFKRWRLEEYYRDEKVTLALEKFHSQSVNGIMQELYASMIMSVIARTLMMLSGQLHLEPHQEAQFKNAINALAAEAAWLVSANPVKAVIIFEELLREIARVKYYRPKQKRPPQARINKSPINKWKIYRAKELRKNA